MAPPFENFSLYALKSKQKSFVKKTGRPGRSETSTTAYKKLKILKVNELVKFEIGKFLHRHFNNELPLNFKMILLV